MLWRTFHKTWKYYHTSPTRENYFLICYLVLFWVVLVSVWVSDTHHSILRIYSFSHCHTTPLCDIKIRSVSRMDIKWTFLFICGGGVLLNVFFSSSRVSGFLCENKYLKTLFNAMLRLLHILMGLMMLLLLLIYLFYFVFLRFLAKWNIS